jgi:N-methylhydantoinase B/oxoprolinase/acetone carboxylase alpha subunit
LGEGRCTPRLRADCNTFSLERKVTPPWGLWGGKDGLVNGVDITSPGGAVRQVRKATQHPILKGEIVRS